MSAAREHARRLSVIGAVKKYLTELEAEAKAEASEHFAPGDRITATTDDGTVVGVVTMTKPGEGSWAVVDRRAFLAWVKKNRPTAIVESVRSSDEESILKGIAANGLIPDGVELKPGAKPTLQVRPDHAKVRTLDWRRYLELEAAPAATPVATPDLVETPSAEVVHAIPLDGEGGLTPCCGKTPFEIPTTHRITGDLSLVTCNPSGA
jgi:hypothetical protein